MYQNNRNLFSFFAVLVAAGLITAVGGLFLYLIDRSGSGSSSTGDRSAIAISSPSDSPSVASTSLASTPTSEAASVSNAQSLQTTSKLLGAHSATVLSVASTSASALIASGGDDNTVKLWKNGSPEPVKLLTHSGRVSDMAFTPDGKQLATGSGAGEIRLWNLATGELAATFFEKSGRIISLAVSPDSSQIASSSSSGALKVWQIAEGNNVKAVKTLLPTGTQSSNAQSSGAQSSGAQSSGAQSSNVQSSSGQTPNPQINALSYSPTNSQNLISGDQTGTIRVWDISKSQLLMTLKGNGDQIVSLAVSSDGQRLASGSYDKTIRIWNLQTGTLLQRFKVTTSPWPTWLLALTAKCWLALATTNLLKPGTGLVAKNSARSKTTQALSIPSLLPTAAKL